MAERASGCGADGSRRQVGRPVSSRRSGRVEEKLQQKIRDGEFYEAHQTYRVLYQRYRAQGKESEALDLLYNGSLLLLQHKQESCGGDLGLLLIDHLKEKKSPVTDDLLERIGNLFGSFTVSGVNSPPLPSPQPSSDSTPESMDYSSSLGSGSIGVFEVVPEIDTREAFLRAALKWSNMVAEEGQWKHGHPGLHKMAAINYWREKQYGKARDHFLYAQHPQEFGNMLVEIATNFGYNGEADLFIAQAVLQLLVLKDRKGGLAVFNTYTRKHPKFKSDNPPYLHQPTLNFIWFLLSACKDRSRAVFQCLRATYNPAISRDPSFNEYLDKIAEGYFTPPNQPQPTGGVPGPSARLFGLGTGGGGGAGAAGGGGGGGLIEGILNSLSSVLPQAMGAGLAAAAGGQGSTTTPQQMNFTVPPTSGGPTHIRMGMPMPMPSTSESGDPPRMGGYIGNLPFPFPGIPANVRIGAPQVNIHIGPPRPRNQAPQSSNIRIPGAPPRQRPPFVFREPTQVAPNIRTPQPQIQVVGIRMEGVPIQVPGVMAGGFGGPGGLIITPEQQQLYQQHTQQNSGGSNATGNQNMNTSPDPSNPPPQPPNDDMELD